MDTLFINKSVLILRMSFNILIVMKINHIYIEIEFSDSKKVIFFHLSFASIF